MRHCFSITTPGRRALFPFAPPRFGAFLPGSSPKYHLPLRRLCCSGFSAAALPLPLFVCGGFFCRCFLISCCLFSSQLCFLLSAAAFSAAAFLSAAAFSATALLSFCLGFSAASVAAFFLASAAAASAASALLHASSLGFSALRLRRRPASAFLRVCRRFLRCFFRSFSIPSTFALASAAALLPPLPLASALTRPVLRLLQPAFLLLSR